MATPTLNKKKSPVITRAAVSDAVRRRLRSAALLMVKALTPKRVHALRKNLRESRAILELLQLSSSRDQVKKLRRAIGKVARPYGAVRDAKVASDVLQKLSKGGRKGSFAPSSEVLKSLLHRQIRHVSLNAPARSKRVQAAKKLRRLVKHDLREIHDGVGPVRVAQAFEESVRRYTELLKDAQRLNTTEALHAWRKRVKYVRYHIAVLSIYDSSLTPLVRGARSIADKLGAHHDLELLREFSQRLGGLGKRDRGTLERAIDRRQRALAARSFLLAKKYELELKESGFGRGGMLRQGSAREVSLPEAGTSVKFPRDTSASGLRSVRKVTPAPLSLRR